jgi:hypothetical protein
MHKTILSFYVDDTSPFDAPPSAFQTFLDFVSAEGAAGESSLILAYDWSGHGRVKNPAVQVQDDYLEQVRRAFSCRVDTHLELYTHSGLYDFAQGLMPASAIHEGVWMFEPALPVETYQDYFARILDHADQLGIRYTGLTWPGCGCPACNARYQQLWDAGITQPNPNVWQALLNLAKADRFRGSTVPCFFGNEIEDAAARLMAGDSTHAVYTLPPNAGDHFGVWLNDPQQVDPDYYITPDGQSGRIVDLVRAGAPYALFYTHWQGLNPANGVGWLAFTQVIQRIQRHLRDQVLWMRPSEYTDMIFKAGVPGG